MTSPLRLLSIRGMELRIIAAEGQMKKGDSPMKMLASMTVVSFAALALCAQSAYAKGGANDTRARLQCSADGASDVSIAARYEERRGRVKFDASFEAAPDAGFAAGQQLAVSVGGVNIGSMTLASDLLSGDVVGDLEFDTRADENNPFPSNFPTVATGMSVTVGNLGCALG